MTSLNTSPAKGLQDAQWLAKVFTHTHTQAHMYTYTGPTHTDTHTHTHQHNHQQHTQTHTRTHTHRHTSTHRHTHLRAYTQTHTHTHLLAGWVPSHCDAHLGHMFCVCGLQSVCVCVSLPSCSVCVDCRVLVSLISGAHAPLLPLSLMSTHTLSLYPPHTLTTFCSPRPHTRT